MGLPPEQYTIAPSLARGLSYYTGAVFETVIEEPPMGSLLGGGRYDELVGMFAGQPIPTAGLAFGLERLFDLMTELGLGPQSRTVSEVFVTLFGAELTGASLALARELRAAGLKVETALEPRDKLSKQFKYADRKGIPFALVLGPDELARGEVVVKDLRSGEQRAVARAAVVGALRGASD
jgi:histidyl-tRNA synthetase